MLRDRIDSPGGFLKMAQRELLESMLRRRIYGIYAPALLLKEAERILIWFEGNEGCLIPWSHHAYPPLLREIYDPPWLLYLRGSLPPHAVPALAVVGSRKASSRACFAARRLGIEAAELSVPVISGLAVGIDHEVQLGASEGGGKSWGVLGSGFDCFYPAASRALSERIIEEGGGLISEFHPYHPPRKWTFPSRNRLISGLSRAVCLIEAPERSGALITADFALEQGRDLYVHGEGLSGVLGAGTKRLADDGAPVLSSMKEILLDWQAD